MTNGIVTGVSAGTGGRHLIVRSADRSWRFHMAVPAQAPVVRYLLADRAALAVGSRVMIKTISGGVADLVSIGRGVTPPM
ncbi:hypothetical protein [Sphingomonas morindae]|uniref:Uncharacterized protein n=1 Tax=Sphingomonas morindae TaxID=1541170 RepID=A0ABY4XAB2_9SPHN|nr:hypothetical protein [Sphingomonas morindae]USI73903.1 hypothetical protein LHA26_05395 [Sphingomonas morindae]